MPFSFRALASGTGGCEWNYVSGDCEANLSDAYVAKIQGTIYNWLNCTELYDNGFGCSSGAPGYCEERAFGFSTHCVPDASFPSGSTADAYTQAQNYQSTCLQSSSSSISLSCANNLDTWLINVGCGCQSEIGTFAQQISLCGAAGTPTACAGVTDLQASDSKGLSGGAIAGIIIGVLAGIAILIAIVVAVCCCIRRKRPPPAAAASKLDKPEAGQVAPQAGGPLDAPHHVAPELPPEQQFHAQATGGSVQAPPAFDGRGDAGGQLMPPAAAPGVPDQYALPPPPVVQQPAPGQQQYAAQHDPRLVYQPPPPQQMAYGPPGAAQPQGVQYQAQPPSQYPPAAYQYPPQPAYNPPAPSQPYQQNAYENPQPPPAGGVYYPPAAAVVTQSGVYAQAPQVYDQGAYAQGPQVYDQAPQVYDDDEPLPEPPAWSGKPAAGAGSVASEPRSQATESSLTPSLAAMSRTSASDLPEGIAIPKGLELYTNPFDNSSEVEEKRKALERAKEQVADVNIVLDYFAYECNGDIDGKYILDDSAPRVRGGQATVAFAKGRYGGSWAIKLFNDYATFVQEESIYKILLDEDPSTSNFIRETRDHNGQTVGNGLSMPSYIVLRKGLSMADWIRTRKPTPLMGLWMLGEICLQVAILHKHGLVHRDLKPGNCLWLAEDNAWRVIDFGCTVPENSKAKPAFTLHFAAPELVAAVVRGEQSTTVHASSDCWSVGVMAFEIISGEPIFPPDASTAEIKDILLGKRQFPHEERPEVWIKMGRLRKVVQAMLSRDPTQRPSIAEIGRRLDNMAMATGASTATYRKRLATTVPGSTFSTTTGSNLPAQA